MEQQEEHSLDNDKDVSNAYDLARRMRTDLRLLFFVAITLGVSVVYITHWTKTNTQRLMETMEENDKTMEKIEMKTEQNSEQLKVLERMSRE